MDRLSPAGFKKLVQKVHASSEAPGEAPVFQDYRVERDGRNYKVVTATVYSVNDNIVRVDYFRGEAEGHVFLKERAYHRPRPMGAIELHKLSKAIELAARIVEHVYGSDSRS